jgi:hypothetical protein
MEKILWTGQTADVRRQNTMRVPMSLQRIHGHMLKKAITCGKSWEREV